MVSDHIKEHGIDLRLETELKEIIDDGTGKVCAVITNTGERIDCGYVGLTAGVSPNISFLEGSGIETQKGILVNEFLETNIPDIYAIGDCSQQASPRPGRRPIEAVWYTGRMMGETVAHTVCGEKLAYDPGIWFNSAKFMDIEYQVYGTVDTRMPENHSSIYWEHPSGRKSIRIVYEKQGRNVIGFNLMGVRYRHEVCEKWIKEQTNVEEVLQNLSLANFDPEFFEEYEKDLLETYQQETGKSLELKQKRSAGAVLQFLGF
jgi:NAD(P)H-nitrite reductase large subunit